MNAAITHLKNEENISYYVTIQIKDDYLQRYHKSTGIH